MGLFDNIVSGAAVIEPAPIALTAEQIKIAELEKKLEDQFIMAKYGVSSPEHIEFYRQVMADEKAAKERIIAEKAHAEKLRAERLADYEVFFGEFHLRDDVYYYLDGKRVMPKKGMRFDCPNCHKNLQWLTDSLHGYLERYHEHCYAAKGAGRAEPPIGEIGHVLMRAQTPVDCPECKAIILFDVLRVK